MKNNIQHLEIPIDEIILLEENPRIISDDDLQKLCDDIKNDPDFLFQRPSLINRVEEKFYCYAGTQRIKAQKLLGYKTAYCFVDTNVPKQIQRERMLKDNLHRGKWDFDLLTKLDFEISELNEIGFEDFQLNEFFPNSDYFEPKNLTAPKINNPPTIKITFTSEKQMNDFEKNLKEWIKNYDGVIYSLSVGEI